MVATLVTMVTSNGTISVARNTTNSSRLNGNSQERERVAGEDRGEHLADGDDEGDDEAVLEVRAHVARRSRRRCTLPHCGSVGKNLGGCDSDLDATGATSSRR